MTREHLTHLTEGELRAHLDGELLDLALREHLAACAACQAQLEALEGRAVRIADSLSVLAPDANDPALAPHSALTRFRTYAADRQEKEKTPMWTKLFNRFRPALIGLSVVAALAIALSFPAVRAWAGQFLGLFRVQQITVLPVDTTRLSELNNDATLGKQIGQFFADSVTVLHEPGEPQAVADAAEASRVAGFNVRLAGNQPGQVQLIVQDGTAFEMVVNRGRAQALLDEAGVDAQLPASLDRATIRVEIPDAVTAAYGNCPNLAIQGDDKAEREHLSLAQMRKCLVLAQIPSPTVTAPPDLDVAQLAEIGLQFMGMSPEEAHRFSQTTDWASTLVVPLPRNAASVEQVSVDGVTGNLLTRTADDGWPPRYTLLWVKEAVIYAVTGFDDPDVGVALANSLQ
jgi:hypothetical protein